MNAVKFTWPAFAFQTVQSQYPTQKTRMRTSFDPELELPKLQRWFAENQHPSRQQVSTGTSTLRLLHYYTISVVYFHQKMEAVTVFETSYFPSCLRKFENEIPKIYTSMNLRTINRLKTKRICFI
jgi:hypothetical protein